MSSFSPRYNHYLRSRIVTYLCTHAKVEIVIDVLVVVYDKTWENWVMLSLHGQLALDIWTRCWPRVLMLTRLWHVNFQHPRSTSLLNIQHYMLLTRWITLQYIITRCCAEGVMRKWPVIYSDLAILRKKFSTFTSVSMLLLTFSHWLPY